MFSGVANEDIYGDIIHVFCKMNRLITYIGTT